jgi:hypothetical protein
MVRNQALAVFHKLNPTKHESDSLNTFDASALTARVAGQIDTCKPCVPVVCPSSIQNITYSFGPGNGTYDFGITLTWDPIPGSTGFTLTQLNNTSTSFVVDSPNGGTIYSSDGAANDLLLITVFVGSCPDLTATQPPPCFLAGSLVTLADLTTKPIEDVKVGDQVLGAFGEINVVAALHRPHLGNKRMLKINDEHSTTSHHPHVSVDKKFYCADPAAMVMGYGKQHKVIDAEGHEIDLYLYGLNPSRLLNIVEIDGVELKTVEGSRKVTTLKHYDLSPDTQLYNLVTTGSHTYHVDGYAVTGWPREDDFDYDTWKQKI